MYRTDDKRKLTPFELVPFGVFVRARKIANNWLCVFIGCCVVLYQTWMHVFFICYVVVVFFFFFFDDDNGGMRQ